MLLESGEQIWQAIPVIFIIPVDALDKYANWPGPSWDQQFSAEHCVMVAVWQMRQTAPPSVSDPLV
jgi:hypothetical protein